MSMIRRALLCLVFATVSVQSNAFAGFFDCKVFFDSKAVSDILNGHNKMNQLINPLWKGYNARKNNYVLLGRDYFSRCAVIVIPEEKPIQIRLSKELSVGNDFYGFYLKDSQKTSSDELNQKIQNLGILSALIFRVGSVDEATKMKPYEKFLYGMTHSDLNVLVHESFHLNTVVAKTAGIPGLEWPSWNQHHDFDDIAQVCYVSDEAINLFFNERAALEAAVKLILVHSKIDLGIKAVQDFVAFRKERYAHLRSQLGGVSCAEAEAIMELYEGSADYVGTGMLYALGLLQSYQVSEYITQVDHEHWFYRSGLAQLLLIRHQMQGKMDAVTQRIANSRTPSEGIHSEFKKAFGLSDK